MTLKVGSLIFATDSGLGILARSFVQHGLITHPFIVRHGHHTTHEEWCPGAPITSNLRTDHAKILEFAASVDVMLFFETPFIWELIPHCKAHGVKTILEIMYECMPKVLPHQPDLFICPSLLDLQYFPDGDFKKDSRSCYNTSTSGTWAHGWTNSIYLPVPVEMPWKLRTKAEGFVHNAGHGGLKGRNGTMELVDAIKYVKSDADIIIRTQSHRHFDEIMKRLGSDGPRVNVSCGTKDYDQLYGTGDVFIFPERHNGLSLPLQEAYASGMLVMSTDRFPMNEWLPRCPLIPVKSYITTSISPRCVEFQSAIVEPRAIAAKIDEFYGRDITAYSECGKRWAEQNSWEKLGPVYRKTLEDLCR